MTSEQLTIEAESLGIAVYTAPLPRSGSISVEMAGDYYIAVDSSRAAESLQRVRMAHELGHCTTGALYLPRCPIRSRRKCERIANEYAYRKLIPRKDLLRAIKDGDTEPWQIAERFNVPEDFAYKAMKYYHDRGMQ